MVRSQGLTTATQKLNRKLIFAKNEKAIASCMKNL